MSSENDVNLITLIEKRKAELRQYVNDLERWGNKKAQAEREYQSCLSQKVLVERDKGTAIGVIQLTVKGDQEVAAKRFERDVAEVMVQVSQENINIAKLELRLLDSQAQREWSIE